MDYLTAAEAAARLGVTPTRVRQMCREGVLSARRHGAAVWLVDPASVEALAANPLPRGWPKGRGRGARPPRDAGTPA